ncbi:PREDICTED: ATP-dependent DNA helicase PIF1-like [Camelina sativa]|uniref:ATP-dependent DNA helicase n=1 Tax=Camelina sativa TaxID=90675 RepID=A0ABM1RG99_CAMSA|nr:PREDICTED: ATP-dependent DNA helicase PIF1-like [Camelina sativa]
MPKPNSIGLDHSNRYIIEEKNYNRDELKEKHDDWVELMTSEQRAIYDEIMVAVLNDCGGVFFVYGFGGTGKTFMWKTLSAAVRYRGLIAINVASSGIASLLLEGGRTAHSRFCIPINPDDFTTCNINPTSDLAKMLKEASLIIWDEAPMMSRYCFENLDRSLSDIMRNADNKPFGGKVVVFGGDFRQVLLVINGAGRAQIVLASLNSSYLWEHCKVLSLTKNMRLMSKNMTEIEARNIKEFSDWILAVGDGKIPESNDGEALIDIPEELLIRDVVDPIDSISRAVYGDLEKLHTKTDPKFFQTRAILCPTNSDVNTINERLLEKLQG